MAINNWVNVTLNTNPGASPRATEVSGTADGGHMTVAWDSAVITNSDQMRACLRQAMRNVDGRLTPP